jgi:hypothetical protein
MVGLVATQLAATDWSNLTVAGAFLLGAAMATIATIRVVKHVTNFYAAVRRREEEEPR